MPMRCHEIRKRWIKYAAGAAALMLAISQATTASAGDYPERPVRFIVPSAAGGGPDTVARLLAPLLSEQMGKQFIVDNRPGGAFTIGINAVAKAAPDGYTIGYGSVGPLAINRALVAKLPYDPDKELQAVAQVGMSQCIVAVNLSLPIKSIRELIDYAKNNPDKLSYAASNGSIGHMSAELFKIMTKTQMLHVPYKGGAQAVSDMIGGQVHVMFGNLPEISSHVRAGKVRALAVTGPKRSPGFPELATVSELGVSGYEAISWGGIIAPAGVPQPIIAKLNAEINKAIATPFFKERYGAIGNEPTGGTPEQFASFIKQEAAKWARVVKHAGIKIE